MYHAGDVLSTAHQDIPVIKYIRQLTMTSSSKQSNRVVKTVASGIVPYAGDLTFEEQARIANWFYNNVPNAKDQPIEWMGRVPNAHAITIVLSHQKHEQLIKNSEAFPHGGTAEEKEIALWKEAWVYQCHRTDAITQTVDVDLESLSAFEERMFENSTRAGPAGNQQWGLDSGCHQGRWYPYDGLPSHWNYGDFEESETEHQVSLQLCFDGCQVTYSWIQHGGNFSDGSLDDIALEKAVKTALQKAKPRPSPRRLG